MAHNKRNEFGSRLGPVVTVLALFALFVPLGIGYVWFKDQNDLLGDQVKKLEVSLDGLTKENRVRRDQLAVLCLPENLEKQVKTMNLGLVAPIPGQIKVIRLTETAANFPSNAPSNSQVNSTAWPAGQQRAQGVSSERNY
jgi:hypothetical protein